MGVPNARFKAYSTEDQAVVAYLDAKRNGRLSVIRNPGDDEVYGPRDDSVQ
jgi:hypothetical protein